MDLIFQHPEFEAEVRARLDIWDRPLTKEDALLVSVLELNNFRFQKGDLETLFNFTNLTELAINTGKLDHDFWEHFPKLKDIYWSCWAGTVDFECFRTMYELWSLVVTGGDWSSAEFKNIEALLDLRQLKILVLHEFGAVDVGPVGMMTQLEGLAIEYARKVENIDAIGKLSQLEELVLTGLTVDNLDFLNNMPDDMKLDICGIHVREEVDVSKWKRFTSRDVSEISANDRPFEYIDLSALSD